MLKSTLKSIRYLSLERLNLIIKKLHSLKTFQNKNNPIQVRGRLAEAEAKKAAEKEKKEVPEEIKRKFETWNK